MRTILILALLVYLPTKNVKNNFIACKKKIVKCRVG